MAGISRRDALRNISAAAFGSVLQVIPAHAAEFAHRLIAQEKSVTGNYTPKLFSAHEYQTLSLLCETILPKDEKSGGAIEAGAPEFIDLLSSENSEDYGLPIRGGLMWLDNYCADHYAQTFWQATPAQRSEVLDLIAYRKNAKADESLLPAVHFFALLRRMTADAFYTSKIGIDDLQYIGNTALPSFPGCPPIPE
jgi:hypothetical protein